MQRLIFFLISILSIAIIVLYVLHFNKENYPEPGTNTSIKDTTTGTSNLKIAYVNIDSLLANYNFYKELENRFLEKQKKLENDLNNKIQNFEKEALNFQKKVQNNSFISQESAQLQQQELMQKEQELYRYRDELTNQLAKEHMRLEKQLLDTVNNFLKIFNKNRRYSFILKKDAILYGDEALDITDTIITLLNKRYVKNSNK